MSHPTQVPEAEGKGKEKANTGVADDSSSESLPPLPPEPSSSAPPLPPDEDEESDVGELELAYDRAPAPEPEAVPPRVSSSFWMGSDWSEEEKAKIRECRSKIVIAIATPVALATTVWTVTEKMKSDDGKSTTDSDLRSSDEGGISAAAIGLVVAVGAGAYAVWNGILTWRGLIADHARKVAAKGSPDLVRLDDAINTLKDFQSNLLNEKNRLPEGDDNV